MTEARASAPPLLHVAGLHAFYGESHVLHGVGFTVGEGEVVTLLGRNGAGKTTALKSIMGILRQRSGSVTYAGQELIRLGSNRVARLGIAYCPEERGIFASLNVEENLLLPPVVLPGGMSLEEVYGLFPNLRERRRSQGSKLSGGEQQMLAIGRILRTGAILQLKSRGYTMLLVEQKLQFAASVADRHYVMEYGRVVSTYRGAELHQRSAELQAQLGV